MNVTPGRDWPINNLWRDPYAWFTYMNGIWAGLCFAVVAMGHNTPQVSFALLVSACEIWYVIWLHDRKLDECPEVEVEDARHQV